MQDPAKLPDEPSAEDVALARAALLHWRETQHEGRAALDPMELAAWLDGHASAAELAPLEEKLQTDPALWRALVGQSRTLEPCAATPAELRAARALVPVSPSNSASRLWMLWRPTGWPSFATAALLMCVSALAFQAGGGSASFDAETANPEVPDWMDLNLHFDLEEN